jgi:tetratricopeptide (TPR) repeat protein
MTTRLIALIALVVGLASWSAPADAAPKKKQPPGKGAKTSKKQLEIERHEWMAQYYLRRAGDLAGAAKEYQAILALAPDNVEASLALSSIYLRDKKDKQAVAVLQKLTKKNPKSQDAWLVLAEVQSSTGDDKGMKASLDKVVALDPQNVRAYWLIFERAQKRVRGGETAAKPEVLAAARKIMVLSRREGPMYSLAERAVVELSGDALELTVYDARMAYASAFESGVIGRINDKMALARKGFEDCVAKAPKNEDCHYYLGLVYSSVKASESYDLKKAQTELALAPSKPLAWVESARLYRLSDKNAEARTALGKALGLDKDLPVAHVELGILDKLDGKTDAAVAQFIAAMDADPYGAVGDRALGELTKVAPTHPRVTEGVLEGKRSGDLFSSERYKSVVALIERELGGTEPSAPELGVLEDIVRRLAEGSAIKTVFKVSLVSSSMVNAFALSDGRVYVTRGLLDLVKKKFPNRPIDANNEYIAHVLGHELAHVIRRHTLNTDVFQEAVKDASRPLDPSVVTHVTRLHEIDADRAGIVMAFLAGYHPRGGIDFMEVMGQEMEIPKHLDHPTFQERVDFLSDYWTNDVRYAFVSFKLGVAAMDRGLKAEATDMKVAVAAYEEAVEDFKRFRDTLPALKEAMNNLGTAYAKIGVLAMADRATPLGRWQTRFSLERDSAVKYKGLARDEETSKLRGTTEKQRVPWQLREAIAQFKEALAADETYSRARLNLALAYLAAEQLDNANAMIGKLEPSKDVEAGEIELVRGVALAEAKDYDKAKAAFEKAMGSQGSKRAAAFNIAKALELAGKKAEAKAAYTQYAKLYPGGPWADAATAAAGKL